MAIETAGQQKYADLTAKRIKSLQTGMIVWISLLCLALISSFSNIILAAIIGIVAVIYAIVNTKDRKAFNSKLDHIRDKDEFYRELTAPDAIELKKEQVLIARDYVVAVDKDVQIYDLDHIKKAEIRQQSGKKTLILTDDKGRHHTIVSGSKNKKIDEACEIINTRVGI